MPSKHRQFVVLCTLLLVVHGGSAAALWVHSTDPGVPLPVTEGPEAEGATLLAAAHHNDAVRSTTTDVRLEAAHDDSNVTTVRIATDPATGRQRGQVLEQGPNNPLVGAEVYSTPWGRWVRDTEGWRYESDEGAAYDPDDARFIRPSIHSTTDIDKTVHENGSVTVTLRNSDPGVGVLSFAGANGTRHYRIAFQDGQPYFVAASATPATDDGLHVRVQRRQGAAVQRPADVPRFSSQEIRDRLVAGGTTE